MTLKNIGHDTANKAIVKVVRTAQARSFPPTAAPIGTFEARRAVDVKFKVSVSDNAEPQSYPLDVVVTYEDYEERAATSRL